MARPSRYRVGIDESGVVHVQAEFDRAQDMNFKWETGFVLHRARDTQKLRWGVWDSTRILWDTGDAKASLGAIDAMLEKGYFLADTLMPEVMDGDAEGSAILLIPPGHQDRVELGGADRVTLESQRELLEEER